MGDGILQAALSLSGIFGGPTLGLYSLGMFIPIMDALTVVIGYFFGFGTALWIYFGSTSYPSLPEFSKQLPLKTERCDPETIDLPTLEPENDERPGITRL